jgi:acetyltransferase-like isoleucine patch superfamily enzyme
MSNAATDAATESMPSSRRADVPARFMGWRDLVITPSVEALVLLAAAAPTWLLARHFGLGAIETALVFYVAQFAVAIALIRLVHAAWPPREGVHTARSWALYSNQLVGFIATLNVHALFCVDAIPPFARQYLYRLLGARFGRGIAIVSGRILDPWLVTIERGALIGDGALVLGHAINVIATGEDALILGRVEIGEGALVGARAIVMPGARIGAHAMIQAMSLVPMGARIPPGEIWAGAPAKKIGEVRR